jgi:hypothetical protein
VVSCTCYLAGLATLNTAYLDFLGEHRPARTTVQAPLIGGIGSRSPPWWPCRRAREARTLAGRCIVVVAGIIGSCIAPHLAEHASRSPWSRHADPAMVPRQTASV